MKKVLGSLLCLILVYANIGIAAALEVENHTEENDNLEFLQYFVKWDSEREPEDSSITEEEYLAIEGKDKNSNGIWDILEEEEEDGVVHAASIETGILGDLNGDSLVDNKDVILLYRHIAGWEQDINDKMLDLNGDGYVNNSDASHLMNYVSGWQDIMLYKGKKNDIIYHLYTESMLSLHTEINNTNQNYYYSSDGLSLKNIATDGYIFEGWYDGEGESANRIRKIDVGETGEIELYARWTPRTYRIDFDSQLVEVPTKYYTIETGATLTNPSLANYIFVGWTVQEDGRLVNGIPKGTFGNQVLVANWASKRNIAKPVQKLGVPVIAEDDTNGRIVFIYELGVIENVPLFTLYRYHTAEGIVTSVTTTEQRSISTTDAKTISLAVEKATTNSATWTLSEGWNESTSVSEETLQEQGLTREQAETIAKTTSNTYRMDTTESYSDVITDSSQHAYKGTVGTGSTEGQTQTTSKNFKYSVDRGYEIEASLESELKAEGVGSVKAGMKATESLDISQEHGASVTNSGTKTNSWNTTLEREGQTSKAKTSTKNWNTSSSYSNSNSLSNTYTTSQQISEIIANKWGYGSSYSTNGVNSSGQAFTTENSEQDIYSNTVTYNTLTLYTQEVTISTDGKIDGYFRQVVAGKAHVFGVVGYDVATRSYFAYTFTVMDDDTYEFLDYSKNTTSFDDNEISVIPFAIPSFVNDYVNSRIARTGGLQINLSGVVTAYTGNEKIVLVPNYWDVNNGDGTYTSVKVTGIASGAFRNNTNIEGVMLSDYTPEIPDSAFEGCISLKDVYAPSLTTIGNRAFYGCTSLSTLTIPIDVVSLGNNAFYNVEEVNITAGNKDVALAAVNSGVKNLVLNISAIDSEMKDAVLEAPSSMNTFEVRGERKQYENLRIKSNAGKTSINGISFVNCTQVPLELHSSTVDLNQATVSGTGYCMMLASNNCNLNLFGTNQMVSSSGNAIVCGNTTLINSNSSVQALLQVSGNIYICGSLTNQNQYLSLTNGNIKPITQEQFDQYMSGVYRLIFDANGGSVQQAEKTAYSGVAVGTLPVATRTEYTFTGWYTTANGGNQVTASSAFTSSSSVTIYAHWSPNPFQMTFNANGGVCATASKTCYVDTAIGTLPTPTRSGCTFKGWYTNANGGTEITASKVYNSTNPVTLYAHWESGWVLESAVPPGARVITTSWSYREDKESTSPSLNGWIGNGNYWRQIDSGSREYADFSGTGFQTSHWLYTSLNVGPYTASGDDNSYTKTEVVNTHGGWVYWHWAMTAAYYANVNRSISYWEGVKDSSGYVNNCFYAIKSTVDCPYLSNGYCCNQNKPSYDCTNIIPSDADKSTGSGLYTPRFFRTEYFVSSYTTSEKVFKYYRTWTYRELSSEPQSTSEIIVSNKVKYVRWSNNK